MKRTAVIGIIILSAMAPLSCEFFFPTDDDDGQTGDQQTGDQETDDQLVVQTSAPRISTASGTYTGWVTVEITCPDGPAVIWYTTDGTAPVPGSCLQYNSALTFDADVTLTAVAVMPDADPSSAVSATYAIVPLVVPRQGLVGEYLFNGDTTDSSGAANDPSQATAALTADRCGAATSAADTTAGSVIVGYQTDQSSASPGYTFAAWVSPASVTGGRKQIISTDNGQYDWSITQNNDHFELFIGGSARTTGFAVTAGRWYFVAAVFDPSTSEARFYCNGAEEIVNGLNTTSSTYAGIAFGINPGLLSESFDGSIDDVRIYEGCLASADIAVISQDGYEVAPVTFAPLPGVVAYGRQITLSCGTANASVYYTTDGSEPDPTTADLYSGPLAVNEATEIRARAVKQGWMDSVICQGSYALSLEPPDFSYEKRYGFEACTVELTSPDPTVEIRYVLTAGSSSGSEIVYDRSSPISLARGNLYAVEAWCTRDADESTRVTKTYEILAYDPIGNPEGISDGNAQYVTLAETDGLLYVAYRDLYDGDGDGISDAKVSVQRYESGAWSYVGSPRFTPETQYFAFGADGNSAYVGVVSDTDNLGHIYRSTGSTWEDLGAIADEEHTFLPIAFHNGTPYIAYRSVSTGNVTVKYFDSTGWVVVGGADFTPFADTWFIRLEVADDNGTAVPYLMCTPGASTRDAQVMRYTGTGPHSGWEFVASDDPADSATRSYVYEGFDDVGFAVDPADGVPYVGANFAGSSRTTAFTFTSNAWRSLPAPGTDGRTTTATAPYPDVEYIIQGSRYHRFAVLGGTAFTAGQNANSAAYVNYNDGTGWFRLGTFHFNDDTYLVGLAMAVDSTQVYVAYNHRETGRVVVMKKAY